MFGFVGVVGSYNLYKVSYIKQMKKKRIDAYANNKIYRIGVPMSNANEIKLKQIYDTAYKSRDRSPKEHSLRKDVIIRYEIPHSDNKVDNGISMNMTKTSKYKAYLES